MSADVAMPQMNDPAFREMLACFQRGEWNQGFEKLDRLIEQRPAASSLKDLQQEMLIRARIDEYERQENRDLALKKAIRWGAALLGFVVLFFVAYAGFNSFAANIQDQVRYVQESLFEEGAALVVDIQFKDAQNYLNAGRPQDAASLLVAISQRDPNYPGLEQLQAQVDQSIEVEGQYQTAVTLQSEGNLSEALDLYRQIQAAKPNYKDVPIQLAEVERALILEGLISQAELEFKSGDWTGAIAAYEYLRSSFPKYEPALVEQRLIDSYIAAARKVLEGETPSAESLMMADQYFRQALALRPMDSTTLSAQNQALSVFKERLFESYLEKARATLTDNEDSLAALATANAYFDLALDIRPNDSELLLERRLTRAYLIAQQKFLDGDWDAVIENLEVVYETDPEYANGTAMQTLYDAYMRRGRKFISNGIYESAISDYQRASEIAGQSPESILQVYWALIQMAEVYGILGEYEKADNLYRHAVEWIGLREILQNARPELIVLLDEADRYAGIEWFRTAYRLYTRVLPAEDLIYEAVSHEVQEGDYLTQLASKFRTTVEAILAANQIATPGDIRTGQRILIPVLRGEE